MSIGYNDDLQSDAIRFLIAIIIIVAGFVVLLSSLDFQYGGTTGALGVALIVGGFILGWWVYQTSGGGSSRR